MNRGLLLACAAMLFAGATMFWVLTAEAAPTDDRCAAAKLDFGVAFLVLSRG